MVETDRGSGFQEALSSLLPGPFSTADFVVEYRERHPREWLEIEKRYGVGGIGAGQHSTVFTHVARRLSRLAKEGEVQKLTYGVAPDWWGNREVQFWAGPKARHTSSLPDEHRDIEFREGSVKLRKHLHRERAWGLSKKKKAEFINTHGKLFCERCGLDPAEKFGAELGAAVIEVHHAATSVGEMAEGHKTRLSDLQCLCANCHRLTHAELLARAG
jgi:hypothetical protein